MRILIAGGAGFIGTHLATRYGQRDHDVTILDVAKPRNPARLARYIRGDARNAHTNLIGPDPYDRVYHLASPCAPRDYQNHQRDTLHANAEGTEALIRVARDHNGRFILASTSEVYGDPEKHPQNEGYHGNCNPTGPRSMYDEAKRYAEALTMAWHREVGVDTRIARIFNTYGPLMPNDGRLVPEIKRVVHAAPGTKLEVTGDGTQTRSLCYIDDLIRGLMQLAACDATDAFKPVNLGSAEEHTVNEIVEAFRVATKHPIPVEHGDRVPEDPRRRRPDLARARALLDYKPRIELSLGAALTVRDDGWYAPSPNG